MKGVRISAEELNGELIEGLVLAREVRDASGRVVFAKGHVFSPGDVSRLATLALHDLHLIRAGKDDVHETDAGSRLAAVVAGTGVRVGAAGGGHWPLHAAYRGVVRVHTSALAELNAVEGLCVYTVFDGQVVDAGESIARAKIVPFLIPASALDTGEAMARSAGEIVRVTPFLPLRAGAVVQESLGTEGMQRFRNALAGKIGWFGGTLIEPAFVAADEQALLAALERVMADGAEIIAVAGSRPMDPLDPIYGALDALDAVMIRRGLPAHPGSLCWLARVGPALLVGMPSCGLFSQATVFDLILTRLFANDPVDAESLSQLGHGGFLTRDMAFRFPPYRRARERGEVE